jgi:prepilin-type processing-associated H-X9-DG protein
MELFFQKKNAFTLIELLAVITTLAILALTLLPAIAANGRDSASIQCLNNLKTLGRAMFMYVDDNDDHLPTSDNIVWFQAYIPYLSEDEEASDLQNNHIFKCPDYPDPSQAITYAANNWAFSNLNDTVGSQISSFTEFSTVTRPAETVYLADYADPGVSDAEIVSEYLNSGDLVYHDVWAIEHLPYVKVRGGAQTLLSELRRVAKGRHGEGVNMLYFDGHANYMNSIDIVTDMWRMEKP